MLVSENLRNISSGLSVCFLFLPVIGSRMLESGLQCILKAIIFFNIVRCAYSTNECVYACSCGMLRSVIHVLNYCGKLQFVSY